MDIRNTENFEIHLPKETREKRGWKVGKVARRLKISTRQDARVGNTNNDRDFCFSLFSSVNYFRKCWDKKIDIVNLLNWMF